MTDLKALKDKRKLITGAYLMAQPRAKKLKPGQTEDPYIVSERRSAQRYIRNLQVNGNAEEREILADLTSDTVKRPRGSPPGITHERIQRWQAMRVVDHFVEQARTEGHPNPVKEGRYRAVGHLNALGLKRLDKGNKGRVPYTVEYFKNAGRGKKKKGAVAP